MHFYLDRTIHFYLIMMYGVWNGWIVKNSLVEIELNNLKMACITNLKVIRLYFTLIKVSTYRSSKN